MTLATFHVKHQEECPTFHVEPNAQILRSPQGNRTGSAHAMRESPPIDEKSSSPSMRPTLEAKRGTAVSTSVGSTALASTQSACVETSSIRCAKTLMFRRSLVDSRKNTAFR